VPLVGIEPSAILGFRDEYPELAGDDLKESAEKIAINSFMVDEFIAKEFAAGRIDRSLFVDTKASILLHAHCQQKAVASSASTIEMLSIPVNYSVKRSLPDAVVWLGRLGMKRNILNYPTRSENSSYSPR